MLRFIFIRGPLVPEHWGRYQSKKGKVKAKYCKMTARHYAGLGAQYLEG